MKKLSKIFALMLRLSVLLLSLTACGSDPKKDAEAAVTKTFDELKALDNSVYDQYFGANGIASLGLTEDDSQEDFKKFIKTIVDNLSYKIVSSEEVDKDNVIVKVDVTAIKMETVMIAFQDKILEFASSEESQNISPEDAVKKSLELLLETISQPNLETITTTVDLNVTKNDNNWEVPISEELINAIYGGMLDLGI
nr:DUF5105 domain-containing protein [uncultured Tyzzerella sp.]